MYSLALWLNVEFMKNVAEIGAGRFLFATEINNFLNEGNSDERKQI